MKKKLKFFLPLLVFAVFFPLLKIEAQMTGVPGSPQLVSATASGTCGKINVSWSPVTSATSYKVYRYDWNSDSPPASIPTIGTQIATVSAPTTLYVDSVNNPLQPQPYFRIYYVKASNSAGDSTYATRAGDMDVGRVYAQFAAPSAFSCDLSEGNVTVDRTVITSGDAITFSLTPATSADHWTLSVSCAPGLLYDGLSCTSFNNANIPKSSSTKTIALSYSGSNNAGATITFAEFSATSQIRSFPFQIFFAGSSSGQGSFTPPTTFTPETVSPPPACTPSPRLLVPANKFQFGECVQTTANLNIRSTANGPTVLGVQASGNQGTVIGGPITAGGYTWWYVDYASGIDGWSAENYLTSSSGQVSPPPPPPPPPLTVPTVDLKVNNLNGPITTNPNLSYTFSWTSTNAASCIASSPGTGWLGGKLISGNESLYVGHSANYKITCYSGAFYNGISASDTVTINVPGIPTWTDITTGSSNFADIKVNGSDGPFYFFTPGAILNFSWKPIVSGICTIFSGPASTPAINSNIPPAQDSYPNTISLAASQFGYPTITKTYIATCIKFQSIYSTTYEIATDSVTVIPQSIGNNGEPLVLSQKPLPSGPLYSTQDAPAAASVALVTNGWDHFKNGDWGGANFDQFQEAMQFGWVPDTPEGYDRFMSYRATAGYSAATMNTVPEFVGWMTAWDWAYGLATHSANWSVDYAPTLWQGTMNIFRSSGATASAIATATTAFNRYFPLYLARFGSPSASSSFPTPPPPPSTNFPAGCTSTSGFSSTTGQPCSGATGLPQGCTSTSGYSVTTGALCSGAGIVFSAGCTSSFGYSPTTGQPCSSTAVPITTPFPSVSYTPPAGTATYISASGATGSRRFSIGDYVETVASTAVRSDSSASSRLLTTYPAGTRGTVVAGPAGANFWQVNFSSGTSVLVGWSTEGNIALADINSPAGTTSNQQVAVDCYDNVAGTFYNCANPPPSTGAINITFTASPTTIVPGGYAGLTWNAPGASTCALSNSSGVSISMVYANFGGMNVSPAQTTTYTLVCTGASGSATRNVTVTVGTGTGTGTTPALTLSASPTSIIPGQSVTLTWSSSNATNCSGAFGSPSGDLTLPWSPNGGVPSGSWTTTLNQTTVFALTCYDANGSPTSRSVTVTVNYNQSTPQPDPTYPVGVQLLLAETPGMGSLGQAVAVVIGYRTMTVYDRALPGGGNVQVGPLQTTPSVWSTVLPIEWRGGSQPLQGIWGSLWLLGQNANATAPANFMNLATTALASDPYSQAKLQAGTPAFTSWLASVMPTNTNAGTTKFQTGDSVQTTVNVNARSTANGTILGVQNAGSRGTVLGDPPRTAGGYTWWNIDYASGADGWSAENYLVKVGTGTPTGPTVTNQRVTWLFSDSGLISISAKATTLYSDGTQNVGSWGSWPIPYAYPTSTGTGRAYWTEAEARAYTAPGYTFEGTRRWNDLTDAEQDQIRNYYFGQRMEVPMDIRCSNLYPMPTEAECGELPLVAGKSIRLWGNHNVYTASSGGTLLGMQNSGAKGKIIAGPTQTGGQTWWNIDYQSGPDGWSASGATNEPWYSISMVVIADISSSGTTGTGTNNSNLTITSDPYIIVAGDSSVISWNTTGTTSCTLSYNNTGATLSSSAISGSVTVRPTNPTNQYNLSCTGPGGSATAGTYVVVSSSLNPVLTGGTVAVGKIIELGSATNVRTQAGLAGTSLGSQPTAARAIIIGGPIQMDGYTWWNVDFNNSALPPADNWSSGTPHYRGWSIGNYMKEVVKLTRRTYEEVCITRLVDPNRYFAITDDTLYKCTYYKETIYFSNGTINVGNWLYNGFSNWLYWNQWTDPAIIPTSWTQDGVLNEVLSWRKWEDLSSAEKTTILQESQQTVTNP